MIKIFFAFVFMFFPLRMKRYLYAKAFGYQLHDTVSIGFSMLIPGNLIMGENSRIGHMNVIKGVSEVSLGESASIGNLNWISGFPENEKSLHFADQVDRSPRLLIGDHAAVTNRHMIDCTDTVSIGRFSTFAGFRSQILTHSISINESRQRCGKVNIGEYSFVGTSSIILPNSCLPSFSVLGAGSVLNKKYSETYQLYAGNPARPIKQLDSDAAYFNRPKGFVI